MQILLCPHCADHKVLKEVTSGCYTTHHKNATINQQNTQQTTQNPSTLYFDRASNSTWQLNNSLYFIWFILSTRSLLPTKCSDKGQYYSKHTLATVALCFCNPWHDWRITHCGYILCVCNGMIGGPLWLLLEALYFSNLLI